MLEIQDKINKDREQILGELTNHLRSKSINAILNIEPFVDYFGRDYKETLVELAGHSIQKIRLYARIYGTGLIIYRFFYDVNFNAELSPQVRRNIATKVKLIKENKLIGLFGGKLVDIRWFGHDIAKQLNSDSKLLQQLFRNADYFDVRQIQIYTESPSRIRILGPKLVVAINELSDEKGMQQNNEQLMKLLNFEIYETIASHVRIALHID